MRHRIVAAFAVVGCLLAPSAVRTAFAQTSVDPPAPSRPVQEHPARSPLMMSLYAFSAVVQGLDAHSTFKALDVGAVEQNPFFGDIGRHRPVFVAFKVGVTAAVVYAASGMAHKSKLRAALALAAVNSAYLAIAHHNYQVARTMRNGTY